MEDENPLNFDQSQGHPFYAYKIKHLLCDTALGMVSDTVWTGEYEATGGYIVAKRDGEVICYHIHNQNDLEDYLLANTKLETASSSRHKFGKLYRDEDDHQLYFKLNLQIRFIK